MHRQKVMIYYGGNDYRDYLAHHGVVGMHWGIRRYQPYGIGYQRKGGEDGKEIGAARTGSGGGSARSSSLVGGRSRSDKKQEKNKKMLDTANRHADEQIKLSKEYIEYHDAEKRVNEYKSKYGDGKTKESQEKWLTDMYGPDWKDASYMKSVWEVDDVHKHARKEIQTEINDIRRLHNDLKNSYTDDLKNWQSFKSRINDTPFEKLSKDDIKRVKRSVKKQAKWDKLDERNARNEKKNEPFEADEKDEDE